MSLNAMVLVLMVEEAEDRYLLIVSCEKDPNE